MTTVLNQLKSDKKHRKLCSSLFLVAFFSSNNLQDEKATGGPGPEDRPVTVEPELRHMEPLVEDVTLGPQSLDNLMLSMFMIQNSCSLTPHFVYFALTFWPKSYECYVVHYEIMVNS